MKSTSFEVFVLWKFAVPVGDGETDGDKLSKLN